MLGNSVRHLYKGTGCNACNQTGYSGRTAIHEVLVMDRVIKTMVTRNQDAETLLKQAKESGLVTLQETCRELVASGVTTIDEMIRMTFRVDA